MTGKVSIFTKAGEVLVLCYAEKCDEAKSCLSDLKEDGYERVNTVPKPLRSQQADAEVQFCLEVKGTSGDVVVEPRIITLNMKDLAPGAPQPLSFKCSSTSGENVSVRLFVKGGNMTEENFDVMCKNKEVASAAMGPATPGTVNNNSGVVSGKVRNMHMEGAQVGMFTGNNYGDRGCDKRPTRIAQNMADGGGVMHITQHGTTNTQHVGKY